MTTLDTATYTCPECGERIESEYVVDPDFTKKMLAHIESHKNND